MIDLGDRVRDRITGYTGVVTSRTSWLNGCARIGVQTVELKDGKLQDSVVFDENQLDLLEARVHPADNRVDDVAQRQLGMVFAKDATTTRRAPEQPGGPRPDVHVRRDMER